MEKNKGGRPRIEISEEDWSKIEKMCEYNCTAEEIADIMGFSVDTLEKRIKENYGLRFTEYYKKHTAKGKIALRRAQYRNAIKRDNTTMQIWLGKQILGQTESGSDEEKSKRFDDITDKLDELIKK